MFCVIRHTFEIDTTDKYNSVGEWKHLVWLFDTEEEAMTFAISLLDNPLLVANEHYMNHAIESLQEGRYWQVGRESVAVGMIANEKIEIIYEDLEDDAQDSEKHIH